MKIDKYDDKKNKTFNFDNNKSFVLSDDDDNIYNFSTPSRSLLSLNSLQPPSFLRENTSISEPNLIKAIPLNNNKILESSASLNDVLDDIKFNSNTSDKFQKKNNENFEYEKSSSLEKKEIDRDIVIKTEYNKNNDENDYSINAFENDNAISNFDVKQDLSFNREQNDRNKYLSVKKEQNDENKDLSINNYNYNQSFESIEEDFEEISVSELNTENDYNQEDYNENDIKNRDIFTAITPNESEEEEEEEEEEDNDDNENNNNDNDENKDREDEEIEEIVEEEDQEECEEEEKNNEKEELEKEDSFDDILISDISRNNLNNDSNNKNDNSEIDENVLSESDIESINLNNAKNTSLNSINEDLNKV
eukprot:jgi/Orpsp1_1/1188201/evm.model.d7180000063157.1